jgi:hypothetical protein
MTSKIRIKLGTTEIEFEGSEDYMRQDLPDLIERLSEIPSPAMSMRRNQPKYYRHQVIPASKNFS